MQITFSTFIGIGRTVTIDFKIKSGRSIFYRYFTTFEPSDGFIEWEAMDRMMSDLILGVHKAGLQKLASRFERDYKQVDDEYRATKQMWVISYINSFNGVLMNVDPIY